MANLIPTVGATGIYRLKTPFDIQIKSGVSYKCVAVRRLQDFVEIGKDPKTLYYSELDDSVWETDSKDPEVSIVSLVSDSGQWIYVPSSFILSYPNLGGVAYTVRLLGINLGAIPDELDLSNLITNVQNLVRDTVGINSIAKSVSVSETKILTEAEHNALEVARQDLITINKTDRARILELEAINQTLRDTNQALEQYIIDNM